MKTVSISSLALALSLCLMSFNVPSPTPHLFGVEMHGNTNITWKNTQIHLGDIPQNKPVNIVFEFTNTGQTALVITSVQASCGCTATDYAKTPIGPGESTKIKAVFNAAAKGAFNKQITVVTSAEETPQLLSFTGSVI